jgi:hypothetical protein
VHPLWFCKHQHDNRVRSKLFVACQRWRFQWRFAAILVNCAPSGEMHNYCTPYIIKENCEKFLIHRCNYILLSQVYCVWQVVKTQTIISNYFELETAVEESVVAYDKALFCMMSGFCRQVDENRAILGYYTASGVISYRRLGTTFRAHLQGGGSTNSQVALSRLKNGS